VSVADPSTAELVAAALIGQLPLTLSIVALHRRRPRVVTRADRVTLVRAALACGCLFLVILALLDAGSERSWAMVALAAPMLLLDAVDGWVARRTLTASDAGARFDMELDAGVVLILSLAVALSLGPWVLVIGVFRYGYAVACWWLPQLATPLARSQFRRVVAGIQGVVLTAALAPPVPLSTARLLVALALVLLIISFASQARQALAAAAVHETV
jgi:phosphatidylglycerophosphate synthase